MPKGRGCRYLLVLCAAIALITATGMYSRHALDRPNHNHEHCDLCLHLGGAAGTPSSLTIPGKPVLATTGVTLRRSITVPQRRIAGLHLPRGPPPA